ncbi:MAG TPA: 1-(5-phosphoribosyl)-5-[(5-phosphoribosylamino)methylideneamino]imidazole-4-carboxamide isomerase [Polyangia bacterium]|jgi:phosphoribosylformimino-5-aminoimidazole carboxamide ribotide isomerase|nr:1-(5-phosphoribosyl)-5-[(5-phosphoribosylamino)methylideneamino]imidazole-4-carboxamide isomerase [Polyangia bacterium]
MWIYPAIDLLEGKVVRLTEGRRDQVQVYSERPGELAAEFARAGVRRLHVVDLDGAFSGERLNRQAVEAILAARVPVQLGGGVRDLRTVERLLETGVERVVLGTAMVEAPEMVLEACAAWPSRVVVAVDAREGRVAIRGWQELTERDAFDVAAEAAEAGCAAVLYTDIARDGTRRGPNVETTGSLARALYPVEVIASGGIGTLDDIRALARAGVPAAVVGRALYENSFTLAEALAAANDDAG